MADSKQAWDEVGERFSELGRRLKDRYDAQASFGEEQRQKLDDALRQLGDALDAGFTAVGESLRDPGMRDDAKQAGTAFVNALTATFNEVAQEIRNAVRKR